MAKGLFLTPNELKKRTNIDGNVDNDKLIQFILVAQETQVQNYMGTNLYNAIKSRIEAETINSGGANAVYATLWKDYVKPMHAWFAYEAYLPFALFEIANRGVYKHLSETGGEVTTDEIEKLMQKARGFAEFYATRFIDYVCDNESSYPEYSTTSTDSDMWPDKDVNRSGWVL